MIKLKKFKKTLNILGVLTILCFMMLSLTSCASKKPNQDLLDKIKTRGKIVAGIKFDAKPFGFIDKDQKIKGFDSDLIRELAKRILGSEDAVEFQQVTSSNRIFSLTSGTVDLVAATMTINPKRKQIIDFSIPYYIAGQAVLVPNNTSIKTLRDLKDKKVIVVLGSTSEMNIRALVPEADILGFRTYTDGFSALKTGRADALTTDDVIITGFLFDNKGYKMLPGRFSKEPYGIGFRKSKNTQSFQRLVNRTLEEMAADGTIDKITKKWMTVTNN